MLVFKSSQMGNIAVRFGTSISYENLNGIEGYHPEHGYKFNGVETKPYNTRCCGKRSVLESKPSIYRTFQKI